LRDELSLPGDFGAVRGQLLSSLMTNEIRLSSMTDGIIMPSFWRGPEDKEAFECVEDARKRARYEILVLK